MTTSIEYGVWSDAAGGFIETGYWVEQNAVDAAAEYDANEEARARVICPDHENEPADACETCWGDVDEDDELLAEDFDPDTGEEDEES